MYELSSKAKTHVLNLWKHVCRLIESMWKSQRAVEKLLKNNWKINGATYHSIRTFGLLMRF